MFGEHRPNALLEELKGLRVGGRRAVAGGKCRLGRCGILRVGHPGADERDAEEGCCRYDPIAHQVFIPVICSRSVGRLGALYRLLSRPPASTSQDTTMGGTAA